MASTTLMSYALTNRLIVPKTARNSKSKQTETVGLRTTHLEKLIQCFGQGYPPSVQLPPVVSLAALYQCEILSLLGSLKQLHQHAYDYRMNSLDLPLVLLDPLSRFRCRKSLLRQQKRRAFTNKTQANPYGRPNPEQATNRD